MYYHFILFLFLLQRAVDNVHLRIIQMRCAQRDILRDGLFACYKRGPWARLWATRGGSSLPYRRMRARGVERFLESIAHSFK